MRVLINVEGISRSVDVSAEDIALIRKIRFPELSAVHTDAMVVANWVEGCIEVDRDGLNDEGVSQRIHRLEVERSGIAADDDRELQPDAERETLHMGPDE